MVNIYGVGRNIVNMKRKIKCLIMLVVCMCVVLTSFQASAADIGDIWEGMESELLENALETEDVWINMARRGTYLKAGRAKISNEGNRVVKISGGTDAHQVCDRVVATIYLDRYENGTWVPVTSVSATATDAYTANCSKNVSVAGGYYYRARGYHTVHEGNTSESAPSLSNGIWID